MHGAREFLKFTGKGERKVAAVFGISPERCDAAVRHVRRGAPDVPVWLFSSREPWPDTAALCERVSVEPDSMELLVSAQKALWPRWVALSVGAWTGERGKWPLKLAPLLVPPFRALLMNRAGDFFPATPSSVLRHCSRNFRDAAHSGWNRLRDVERGLRLWCLGVLAERASWLTRRAFLRGHGRAALPLGDVAPAGEGTLVYRYAHRQWDWAEIDRLARASACRRILFLADGAEDDLPWVGGDETFAVARQTGFRAWKPCIFPNAPFRRLQPDEVSRTLAPVSSAILVDRAKLAAAGVPRTAVPGAAWLMLFWKAAAAGWHSYSVGGQRELREIHDWPLEEAEAALRILADPALRALGPRDPDLARGNIASALTPPAAPAGPRPRVLVVSPYLPWPLSHGGAVRIWNLCRALAGRVDFTLACFREENDAVDYPRLREVFREVHVIDRDERPSGSAVLPAQVREHASRSLRALIASLEPRIDLLQVEFTHMAAFRDAAPRTPAILVEHDLAFTLYRQLAQRNPSGTARGEAARWLDFERRWLAGYDGVWTMSEQDRIAALAEGSPPAHTRVVPNGVDAARFTPSAEPGGAPEILYVGSFRHLPNLLGFEKLRHHVMPAVWERFPEARLRVVAGPEPQHYWQRFLGREFPKTLDPRIVMHAFLADLRPLYAGAAAVAVPLEVSAGTNIKVLEAMACGKAVVSTAVGCQGLGLDDGHDILIREDSRDFAAALVELLAGPDLRMRIGCHARATVERRFTWDAIAAEAWASYQALASRT